MHTAMLPTITAVSTVSFCIQCYYSHTLRSVLNTQYTYHWIHLFSDRPTRWRNTQTVYSVHTVKKLKMQQQTVITYIPTKHNTSSTFQVASKWRMTTRHPSSNEDNLCWPEWSKPCKIKLQEVKALKSHSAMASDSWNTAKSWGVIHNYIYWTNLTNAFQRRNRQNLFLSMDLRGLERALSFRRLFASCRPMSCTFTANLISCHLTRHTQHLWPPPINYVDKCCDGKIVMKFETESEHF